MDSMQINQIRSALDLINQILPLVDDAERAFSSARNWGFLDIFGGGFIIDMIKHHKLGKAADNMNRANYLLKQLEQVTQSIRFTTDYSMNTFGFATMADFMFDGAIADIYMQSKIMSSLNQVRQLKFQLLELDKRLRSM